AVHALLVSDFRCGSLAVLEADAARQAKRQAGGKAADRDAELALCVARRSEPCSAASYLTAVVGECRRPGGEERCLGLRAAAARNSGPPGWTCTDFRALDEGVRECWRANGTACLALPLLAKRDERPGCESASPAGEDLEPAAVALAEAIWDWALDPFRLVAPREELHRLGASQSGDFFSPEMAYHHDFLFCVYHTLQAMAESPDGGVRRWVIPGEPHPGPTDPLADDMQGMPDFVERCQEEDAEVFRGRHEGPDHYEIVFRPRKWIPGGPEGGPAAVERIVVDFKARLERMLDAEARRQLEVGNLVTLKKQAFTPERARVLALYQVHGETLAAAGEKHPDLQGHEQKYVSDVAGRWTREAAQALMGPHYTIWYREPKIGYPKGKKRGPGSGGGPNG
ncbi:MAG: hypothetical protein ACKODX_03570, partial [Gemmata sp.]